VGALASSQIGAATIVTRFGVRPLIFFGGGHLVLTDLYTLVPHIRNLESSLRKEKAARAADGVAEEASLTG
jgi:hypothetical protein